MKVKQNISSSIARSTIEGELTIYNAAETKTRLINELKSAEEVELDLSQVSEIDSAGVQLLMLAKHEAQRQEKALRLVSHSRAVLDIFELFNLAAFFGDPILLSNSAKDDADSRSAM